MRETPQPVRTATIVGLLGPFLLVGGLSACSSPPDDAAGVEEAPQSQAPGPATAEARDLTTFDVCAKVTAAEVAVVLEAPPDRTIGESTMGSMTADCTYTVERGDDLRDYAMVWVYPPQAWESSAGGESIDGLGDAAFLDKPFTFDQVNVLVEGDFFLQARANSPEQARALAELAVARLTARAP